MVACNNARLGEDGEPVGDPTEVAMVLAAAEQGVETDSDARAEHRRALFHFDAGLKLMSTVDEQGGELWVDAKGAPEAILARCTAIAGADGPRLLDDAHPRPGPRRHRRLRRRRSAGAGGRPATARRAASRRPARKPSATSPCSAWWR